MKLGCVVAFLTPFFLVALGTAGAALWNLSTGDFLLAGIFSIFAITFGGMATFVLRGALEARKLEAFKENQQQRYPTEPWMWRAEWANARIESQNRGKMKFAWFFAIMWNAIAMPSGVVGVKSYLDEGETAALLTLIFPFIGLFLLIWAVRETIRCHKFGVSELELDPLPGVIGSGIKGTVRTAIHFHPDESVVTTLSCVRRYTTGSGKNRSTKEDVLWRDEREITRPRRELHRLALPIAFRIPKGLQPSDDSNPSDKIIWRLEVKAAVPGVDYHASFDVPVFDTGQHVDLPESAWASFDAERAQYEPPGDSKIQVTTTGRGIEIYYPAARNPGIAFAATMFLIVWVGITVGITIAGAPILFPIVFGVFSVILLVVVPPLWFATTRVVAGRTALTVTHGFLFMKWTKELEPAAVEDVAVDMGMKSNTRVFYRIVVRGTDGTKVPAGRGIDDKREAEWLANRIKEAIQLSPSGSE